MASEQAYGLLMFLLGVVAMFPAIAVYRVALQDALRRASHYREEYERLSDQVSDMMEARNGE